MMMLFQLVVVGELPNLHLYVHAVQTYWKSLPLRIILIRHVDGLNLADRFAESVESVVFASAMTQC